MPSSADLVRDLARRGVLADRAVDVTGSEYARLTGGAYDIVWQLVFERHTRGFEIKRGHPICASSVSGLRPDCLDRFQDDVEAVLEDLLRNAKVPILNLEGWITRRINAATVDAHRRRRGERGALQRPRLPQWLTRALRDDPWLTRLAVELLIWVGVPVAAGAGLWPLNAWADLRATVTGDLTGDETTIAADVETVLTAMRQSRTWYTNFVERPLGRKQAPVLSAPRSEPEPNRDETDHLPLTERHETDDAHLHDLAAAAVRAIERRLANGEDPRDAVRAVVVQVFSGGTGAEDMDRTPGTTPGDGERVLALLADPAVIDRITSAALEIVDPRPTN
ncbi:hypothetical protein GCM10010399_79010 [Dactylosporangium fulvum]|uniref:Uncharacterized protein n=1 Tax=Dactylosporangium fulvum TaxID=53359 RepID=A0ABY5W123_9ACTN|nr:hypothetical protein [Dactylosporangium fulvum]UWP83232.1 hypothetical protein Dfulv_02680 [Dactylosporangium fulvum]